MCCLVVSTCFTVVVPPLLVPLMSSLQQESSVLPAAKRVKLSKDDAAKSSAVSEEQFTVVSFNIAGFQPSKVAPSTWTDGDSMKAVERTVLQHTPNVIALQEVPLHALDDVGTKMFSEYELLGSQPTHAGCAALLVHHRHRATKFRTPEVDGMPAVVAEIDVASTNQKDGNSNASADNKTRKVLVASVHLEPFAQGKETRRRQLNTLVEAAEKDQGLPMIVAGDTNMRVAEDKVAE